jgi:hypothetical protein
VAVGHQRAQRRDLVGRHDEAAIRMKDRRRAHAVADPDRRGESARGDHRRPRGGRGHHRERDGERQRGERVARDPRGVAERERRPEGQERERPAHGIGDIHARTVARAGNGIATIARQRSNRCVSSRDPGRVGCAAVRAHRHLYGGDREAARSPRCSRRMTVVARAVTARRRR